MNFSNNKAIYLQIVDDICDHIATGKYEVGRRLPSVRELSAVYQVNVNTVMRSVEYLQNKDIAFNKRGIGYFITPDAPEIIREIKKNSFLDNELDYFFRQLYVLGVGPDDLARNYSDYCSRQNQTN